MTRPASWRDEGWGFQSGPAARLVHAISNRLARALDRRLWELWGER